MRYIDKFKLNALLYLITASLNRLYVASMFARLYVATYRDNFSAINGTLGEAK